MKVFETIKKLLAESGELRAQGEILGMDEPDACGNLGDDYFGDAQEDEAEGPTEEIAEGEADDMTSKIISLDPGLPSQGEIEEHGIDHMPFRQ